MHRGQSVAFLYKINLPLCCISLSQSATLTNAGGFAAARSGPFFIAGLCSRGLSVSVIRIWGLSWLTYVLSLLVQPFPPLTHYCTDSGRGSSSTISLKCHGQLPTRATNTSLKASIFLTFIPSQDTYFYKEVMWNLKSWAPHIKGHFKFTSLCPNRRAKLKSCPKCPSQLSNRKTNKSQGGLWGREQDGSWLFSKGINLAWPSWAEPSFE